MSLAVGTKGIDSASRVDPTQAKASGSMFQVRYSAGAASDPSNSSYGLDKFKLCQPDEIAAIIASGQDFLANDEWTTDRMYSGAAGAEQDAPVVLKFWRSCNLHPGSTIQLNHDTGLDPNQLGNMDAYIDRYNQILGGEYLADGFYGPLAAARHFVQGGRIKHFWIPEGASFFGSRLAIDPNFAPPAKTTWDLWAPTPSQVAPAIAWLQAQLADILPSLQSVIWQDLNHWFNAQADEDIVIKGDHFGSHLEAAGGVTPPPVVTPPPPAPAAKWGQGTPVPALISGGGQYLGSISGPAASHGGYNAAEKGIVQVLQRRLIACGFVPGISDVNSGWADGIFDTPHDAPGTGATSQAVTRFHNVWYPNQPKPAQIWADDWNVLFNHA